MVEAIVKRIIPTSAARYAADLEIFLPRQGEALFANVPLEVEASFGEQEFSDGEGFGFKLSFRRCFIEIILENCEISRDGRYQRSLKREQFRHFLKRESDISSSSQFGASGRTSLQFSKILTALGVEANMHGQIQKSLQSGRSEEIESHLEFKIVRWLGAGRWQVGHEVIGDPNEPTGALRGGYLSEPADLDDEKVNKALCMLTPEGGQKYAATIELRAKKTDCIYLPVGDVRNEERWIRKNKTQVERLLALKMLEEQNRADGFEPPEGELVLSRGRIEVSKSRSR